MLRDRPPPPAPPPPERPRYRDAGYPKFYDYEGTANKPPGGTLNCIDLNTGKLLWKVPHGEYPELAAAGAEDRHGKLRRAYRHGGRAGLLRRSARHEALGLR
jgi:hypothetical protein